MRRLKCSIIAAMFSFGLFNSGGCCFVAGLRATCAPIEESKLRSWTIARTEFEAKRIWKDCYAARFADQPCGGDVKLGFVIGYTETAMGGTGCPPPIPERPMLSVYSLTHSYPQANQWYEGYALGYTTALSRGADRRRFASINPELLCAAAPCRTAALGIGPTRPIELGTPPTDPGLDHAISTDEHAVGTENLSQVGEAELIDVSSEVQRSAVDVRKLPIPFTVDEPDIVVDVLNR